MKILYKLITWPVAIIFLSQNIAWAVPAPQLSRPRFDRGAPNYQPLTIFVPAQYGSIEKSQVSSLQSQVIIIKDAHCNYEAQTNIARILDILIRDYKIDLVCVEGAEGLVNTSPYNAFPDQEAREKVTDRYVKKGVLSASEALGISRGNKQPFTIWGVEDSRLYLEDLKAFRETFKDNAGYIQLVAQLIKAVTFLKDKNYNIRLLGFDKRYNEYEEDKISLSDWIKKLSREYGVRGKNHNLALKAIKLEGEIDFNKVESERAQLIKELEKTLPKEGLQELVKQSLLFKLGKIPAIEYYTYLGHFGLPFNLRKYIRLIRIQSRIDSDELFHELSCLESTIYTQLCQAEVEKKLHRIDYNLKILNKLLNLQISRQELEYYKANINEFNLEKIMEFINIPPSPPGERVRVRGQSAERFYELAIHRDKVLVSNLLAKMEKDKKQNAAMVIGGFHAEGIIKRLEDEGISYLVISPKITKIQEDSPYLSIMLDEKIDIDKLLENISLAPPLPLGNIGNPEVRKRLASALISSRKLPLDKYTGPAREALQALCTIAGIVPEEERPIAEFLQPAILADRIISEENPTFAAFLLELLKAQVRENTSEVKQALRKVVTDSGNPEIVKLAKGYIITPEEAEELKQRLWAHYQTTESGRQNGEIHYSHTMRLIPLATELAMQNNADMDILIAAVILHDISKEDGRLTPEGKAHTMRNLIEHHIRGAIKAREILTKMEKDSEFISRVEEAILRHMGPMGKYSSRIPGREQTAFMEFANTKLIRDEDRDFKDSRTMQEPNDKESAILYIVDMMDMMADGITKITDLRQQPGSFFLGQDQKYAAENGISNVVSVSAYYSPNSAFESLLACGENIERTAKRFGIEGAIELIGELKDAVDTFFKELDWKGINTGLDFAKTFYRLSKKSMYHYLIIRQLLSESDIGRYLDSETIDKLARNPEIKLEVHGRGEEVVKEGDPPDSIYLIVSGELAAKSTASGDIGILKKNDLFGETAVLTNQPQSATVKVESGRAILLRLTPKAIEGIKVELERLPPLSPIIPFPAVRQEPPPARVSLGTKSHKGGTPKIAGRDATNEDVDYIIEGFFRQDMVAGGFRADATREIVNEFTGRAIEFRDAEKPHFEEAIGHVRRNMDGIITVIKEAEGSDLLNLQLSKLNARRQELQKQGKDTTAIDEHIELLEDFIRDPLNTLNERLGSVYSLILKGLDFLVFNDPRNYWGGHSPTSRNAIYLPEWIYMGIKGSPEALAAFLIDKLVDAIVGEHTPLSDRLIRLLDPEEKLAELINIRAHLNNNEVNRLANEIAGLVNSNSPLEAVMALEDALGKTISPSALPVVLEMAIEKIKQEYTSIFPFLISGSEKIRDTIYYLIRADTIDFEQDYSPLARAVQFIYRPLLMPSDFEWLFEVVPRLIKNLSSDEVADYFERFRDNPQKAKRYLATLLLELRPNQNLRDFIYRILALPIVREIYSPGEYTELVIQTISKIDRLHIEQIENLFEQDRAYSDFFGLDVEMIRTYLATKREPIIRLDQIDVGTYPEQELKEAGYDTPDDFRYELFLLFNETDSLRKSLPPEVTPERLKEAVIEVSHKHTTKHTLVSLVKVRIGEDVKDEDVPTFVHKKLFKYFYTLLSDVFNFYHRLDPEMARNTLAKQHGEWITPFSRDGRLIGYHRTEEFLPGFSIYDLNRHFAADSKEYELAEALAVAAYYNLFINLAGGRWFLGDPTLDNVRIMLTKDDKLTAKIVDIEARIELPEIPYKLKEKYFKTWLRNQGFSEKAIKIGIDMAEAGYFNISSYDSEEAADLIGFAVMGKGPSQITIPEIEVPTIHAAPTEVYQAALAHFEELEVSEDLPNARGILSVKDIPGMGSDERENTKRIVDFIQKNGKPVETGLGLPVMIWDRPQDKELNNLLLNNLAKLLPEEFLTVLKANAPPEGLVLAILDKSQHLGENCQGDGFIGVNRYLLQKLQEATDQPTIDALSNLLQVILYHELRHEALIFEKEVLMEKFGYRPEALSTRENILEALGKLSPEKHRVLTAEVEFRQNLVDIEVLDPLGLEILISLRLIKPDSFFTASIMNPQKREELRELGQTLYDNRYDQEKIGSKRTPVNAWVITPDGQVGQIEEVQYIPGVGYGVTIPNSSELLIGALPGKEAIYTTDLLSCVGIAFIGVKDGKPICGLAHILPSELEQDLRESRILQILKEQGIEITQMQILVTNDNTVSIDFIERAIENIKTAFPLPKDKLRILRSTANSHMAVGNDGVTVIRFVLDKKGNWAYGTPVRQLEIIPSPWAKTSIIEQWHMHIKNKITSLSGPKRNRVQKILDDEGPLGPKILDFIREQAVPPTQEQSDVLSKLNEFKPDISPDMVFFIPRDSLASELFEISEEQEGMHLILDDGVEKIRVILIPSDNKNPLALATTLIHESYHTGAMIKTIGNISSELAMAIDEGMADILTEEMIAKILESGHPLAQVLTVEINKAWEELLGLGIEGPAETAMDKWHRIAAETSIYAYYRDLVNALRMAIGLNELIRMYQTGLTHALRQVLGDRLQYLEKLAMELTVFLDNPFSIITTKEIRAVINNPDYNSVRYFAYRLFRGLLIDPDNFPGIEKDPMAWLQFIRLYLMRGDIYSSLISELTNPLAPKSEHQAKLRAHWEKFLVLKETINTAAEIAKILKKYGIEIDGAKEKRLRKVLIDAYEDKVQIKLLELMQTLAERIEPEKIFQLTAEIAEPISRFLGQKAADKGGKMVAAVLQEILELMPIVVETEEDKLLKTIQALASEKGIDPNAMQSVFDLFKSGLEILAVDPSYKLDSNYFILISQIEKLTGVDDKKIIEVFSRRGLARERAEPVPNSPLAQEVEKLGLYIELNNMSTRADLDLGLEKRRGLFYLDNLNARIEKSGDIQFLSSVDAVNKDLAKAYSEVQLSPGGNIIDRKEKITLVISADTLMSIERDGRFLRFSYKPGIQALLRILANSKNIHIVIRADTQAKQVLKAAGILNEQITVEDTDKKLEHIRTDAELKDWAKDEGHVVFILTPKEGEELKTEGIKAFGIAPDTAFHAALVFGVIYAQAITMDEIVTAINSLKLLGVAPAEVDEIVCQIREEGLGFFTVKLVRIEETLKEFQNRRLYFEAAA